VLGQNVRFRDSGLPNLREGYDPVGTEQSNATPVDSAWVFETRDGDIFEIKAYNGSLYYFLVGTSTEFALLKSGFTAGLRFGYANIGESSGLFHSMFCNGTDPWYEFNGAHAVVDSVTINTIKKTGGGTFSGLAVPFYSAGTRQVIINGILFTYTGGEGTDTLTGVTPDPSANGITPGMLMVQAPRAPSWRVFLPFGYASTASSGSLPPVGNNPPANWLVGETVTGGKSSATATVVRAAGDGTFIVVTPVSGTFVAGETVTGGTTGSKGQLAASIDTTVGPPLAQIISAHLSRIHCWSAVKKSVWAFSVLDDPYCWSVFAADTSGGRKDVEFGGPGTAFGRLNQTVLGYKKRGIMSLDFVQTGQRVDVPRYTPLIQSDDKGTTLGAIGQRSTFASPYGMISITADAKMILLRAISNNDQPDYSIISDPIQPVFNMADHSDASGFCVDGVLWYTFKASSASYANETVLTGDLRRRTVDAYGNVIPLRWDLPYIGWQVKDWTAIPASTGSANIHWHSSLNSNTYLVEPLSKEDDGGGFTANARTWSEFFEAAFQRKRADKAYIEILMRENSVVDATLLLDEEGTTDKIEKTMRGIDVNNRSGAQAFNPNGASVFGSQKIGSNGAIDDRKRYRYYFEFKTTQWFFNMALQLASTTENSDFELVRWCVHIVEYEPNTPKNLAI
jgi:hypothetical protein